MPPKSKKCLNCKELLFGRIDKVFCNEYCKSAFNYLKNKNKEITRFRLVNNYLKTNRKVLSIFNKAGKAVVRKEDLENEGFNPNFFTNYWKNQKGEVYLFCYDFGFLKKTENGRIKYVLVKWQKYMEK